MHAVGGSHMRSSVVALVGLGITLLSRALSSAIPRKGEFGSLALGLVSAPPTLASIMLTQSGPPALTQTVSQHAWNVVGRWRWGQGATEYNALKNSTAC